MNQVQALREALEECRNLIANKFGAGSTNNIDRDLIERSDAALSLPPSQDSVEAATEIVDKCGPDVPRHVRIFEISRLISAFVDAREAALKAESRRCAHDVPIPKWSSEGCYNCVLTELDSARKNRDEAVEARFKAVAELKEIEEQIAALRAELTAAKDFGKKYCAPHSQEYAMRLESELAGLRTELDAVKKQRDDKEKRRSQLEYKVKEWAELFGREKERSEGLKARLGEKDELIMGVHPSRYSISLEIKKGLEKRGFWTPKNWVGADLITAVFMALDRANPPATVGEGKPCRRAETGWCLTHNMMCGTNPGVECLSPNRHDNPAFPDGCPHCAPPKEGKPGY